MHLLAATSGAIDDGAQAVDLGQTPGEIAFLTAADTEIACLATAQRRRLDEDPSAPSLRAANLMHLGHNYSVDLYVESMASQARLIVCRVLGGRSYWPYGVDELAAATKATGAEIVFLPGDDKPDAELYDHSTIQGAAYTEIWEYFTQGGVENAVNLLRRLAHQLGRGGADALPPTPLVKAGLYWPGLTAPGLADLPHAPDRPKAAILFYRALVQAGNTAVIDALIEALAERGLDAVPIFAASMKDPVSAATIEALTLEAKIDVALNGMGFAVSQPGAPKTQTPLDAADSPVLQLVFSGGGEEAWRERASGLSARDIAMNVALPEVDGRILSRAVSFKGAARRDETIEADIVAYEPVADRCNFVADLAAAWARLRRTPAAEKKLGLVLANYPNRDGRMGNGVGLDTPAGALEAIRALAASGHAVELAFEDGDALIRHLAGGPTNAATAGRAVRVSLARADYDAFWDALPEPVRSAITERWGGPEADPFYRADSADFALPIFTLGNLAVGLQPARGYNIDPVESYHDPALPPPHGYLAFYAWLRHDFGADAVIHFGKHGTLEWLPGKAVGLSADCFPEAVFGPTPHLYPFIVNDPGEGTQAKRRAQAVIIDHLTPPLTRAESYGPLRDLELLVDEYYEASQGDPRRVAVLRREILETAQAAGLDADLGLDFSQRAETPESDAEALTALDNHLCELKELQIRDGLHVFGKAPTGRLRTDTLAALTRTPRASGDPGGGGASILSALSSDLGLPVDFNPLDPDPAGSWRGPRPDPLAEVSEDVWRSEGDTLERLEILAARIIEDASSAPGPASAAVLAEIESAIAPNLDKSGAAEIDGLLRALAGRFVQPGPSGAPTRGKPEVLPTGRNFYSVDTRMTPTQAAWSLGWKSAQMLVERHAQDHGDYPKRLIVSAWGTANMRTGGDDVAQALALMGARPVWDTASRRVTGFEILPPDVLGRPRVDVTFRISGFFRDAFPNLIDLVDSAARAVAALDEPEAVNPLAAAFRADRAALLAEGVAKDAAERRAGSRVYGSKPGAYGAGLQALIDERLWKTDADFAEAYLAWGGYAYGAGQEGASDKAGMRARLGAAEAVVHNQDNREHDLLDSDDYYQFEGGAAAAVRAFSGADPAVYHNDHARPETPRIRTLQEEIARVVRARVVNPKWIEGVMRHGYKGAFEMAATVDYLFAFAATTTAVGAHQFDLVMDAYIEDETVRAFIAEANPAALREIAARLLEAQDRGLWTPRRNSGRARLESLLASQAPSD